MSRFRPSQWVLPPPVRLADFDYVPPRENYQLILSSVTAPP
jgi:hypothetical protein